MKFGEVALEDATGAILAHSIRLPGGTLKKGRVLGAADIALLREAGREHVVAARLEPGDLGEDEAAARLAASVGGGNLTASVGFTGRCNLFADRRGLAVIDAARVDAVNLVDEAVTVATVPPFTLLEAGDIIATVKIIPFAVHRDVVARCAAIAAEPAPLVRLAAFRPATVGLVQTRLPGIKESILEKAVKVTRDRLATLESTLAGDIRCAHDEAEIAAALTRLRDDGCGIILVLGASAITDRRDVVPGAVARAGGAVLHLGMPVDPGNLMLLARLGDSWVLGLPGSARSPRLHGFDWVLQRLIAGIAVSGEDLMRMGVGGLLKEIPTRPLPRAKAAPRRARAARKPRIAAVILAAGQSRRMGSVNKLLADVGGRAMLTRVADAAIASAAGPVIVVTGHEPDRVQAALDGLEVTVVHNPDYAEGLSTSLKCGLGALGRDVDGALICLGDMPDVAPAHLDKLIAGFDPANGRSICVPTFNGKRGNPVLWDRRYFAEMATVAGDVGARHLIGEHEDEVFEVAMPDDGVLVDLDTPSALAARRSARAAKG